MISWIRYLSIRSKLIILVLALLAIPWMGNRYVGEMKAFLLQGQKDALLLTASGIATILNEQNELFRDNVGVPELIGEQYDLFAYRLPRAVSADGDPSDWSDTALDERRFYTLGSDHLCEPAVDPADFEVTHILGYRGVWFYALFEVRDEHIVYRNGSGPDLGNSDHIRILIQHADGPLIRYVLVARQPGRMSAYLVGEDWQLPEGGGQAVNDVFASLRKTEVGYTVELRMPRPPVAENSRMGFVVVDVDDPGHHDQFEQIATFPLAKNNLPGRVLLTSPKIAQLLRGLDQPNSRIWVLDKEQQVRAVVGGLSPPRAVETPAPESPNKWSQFKVRFNNELDRLLTRPDVHFEDLPSDLTHRREEMFTEVLAGQPKSDVRRSVDNKVKIVMAGYPIRSGGDVMGAVVVEQSSHAILTSQYELLKSMAAASLLVFAFVTLMLIIFAWRLTVRIGRLRDTTDEAISIEGRVRENRIPVRLYPKDELGDLGRSITAMLKRLSGYTRYLEGLPDTLAHELNNPLNVVSSSLQNLEQENPSIKDNVYVERARGGVQRLRNILSSLTDAANLEEAMQSEQKTRINICQLVTDYVEGVSAVYPFHRIEVVLKEDPIYILGSGDHLAELLDKLIDNAVQFGVPNTVIQVTLRRIENSVEIAVANEGATIPLDMRDRVFDPMVSIGRKDAKKSHLGLGLYVVRLIVGFHGGYARIDNRQEGTGVVVTITLPCEFQRTKY